jgi:DNA-binding IclR family transcriptional regulator
MLSFLSNSPSNMRDTSNAGASKARRGIQSIEVGGQLLLALARSGVPMMLKDLAREAGMVPAKAHPYLVSFGKLGLIEQDPVTGRYELGRLALELGLMSLQRLDPVRVATPEISALAARVAQSGALAVWGTHGPTIVRFEESTRPIHVNLRTGTVMSLVNSATGQIFAAFLPPKMTESLIRLELQRTDAEDGVKRPTWKQIEATLSEVRARGLARAVGNPIPGVNAFSAPVFDHTRNVVLAMTLLGPQNTFDADWRGPIARALLEASAAVSSRLGYRP